MLTETIHASSSFGNRQCHGRPRRQSHQPGWHLNLSPPGSNGPGTNPEQLFAAGYSACFGGAIGAASALAKISLRPSDIKVTATVNLNKDDSGYFLNVTLDAELNGVDQLQAEALVAKAHTICPYSKATRGNIEVALQANGKAVHAVA